MSKKITEFALVTTPAADDTFAGVQGGENYEFLTSQILRSPVDVFNIKHYGAVGDGITDDTASIQAAIDAASVGGGKVIVPNGVFGWSGEILVGNGVDVWGNGRTASGLAGSVFKALSADANISFGSRTIGRRAGITGNFTIDANELAVQPLYIGLCGECRFESIQIIDAAAGSAGFLLEAGQNNTFIDVTIQTGLGDGVVLDYGAGGNVFLRCGVTENAGYNIRVKATGAGPYETPTHNEWIHSVVERKNTGGSLGQVLVEDGHRVVFDDCIIAATSTTVGYCLVEQRATSGVVFRGTRLVANTLETTTGIKVTGGEYAVLELYNGCEIHGCLYGIDIDAEAIVRADWIYFHSCTNSYGGAGDPNARVRVRMVNPIEMFRDLDTDSALILNIDGEAGSRLLMSATGKFSWMDGSSFSYDTNLYRSAANVLKTDDKLVVALETELDGDLNHDGINVGLYGTAPTAQAANIANPAGGGVVDIEARTAIDAVLAALEGIGITST